MDASGTPRGRCGKCYARRTRAARRAAPATPATPTPHPPASAGVQSRVWGPSTCLASSTMATSALVVSLMPSGGCTDTSASVGNARVTDEPDDACHLQARQERGRAAAPMPGEAADAQLCPPADPHEGAPAATGGAEPLPAPTQAAEPAAIPSCKDFLDCLVDGNYGGEEDKSVLEAIANAILLRGKRPQIRLKHTNGRVVVYARQMSPRKALVKSSQANKRPAAARKLQEDTRGGMVGTRRDSPRPAREPVRLTVAEQVGLAAALRLSHIGFNRWRLALGGRRSGLASLSVLRAARRQLSDLPGKQVIVTGSGAHLASLTAAIQERVSALCDADAFVERPLADTQREPSGSAGAPAVAVLPGSPSPSELDVQITLGLDKGGDPGTVKIVATIINQAHPNSPSNTILVAVCPCQDDKYEELAAMLETHLPQVDALLRDGVLVRGVHRPVRLLLGSDYAAQCNVLGHKGESATQPCLGCKSTRFPSVAQAVLDDAYGTLQDVDTRRHLREATHFADRMVAEGAAAVVGEPGTAEHHCSVERSPLLAINPRQIVPIPLHCTLGINHRYLRLAVEMVMVFRSSADGAAAGRQAGASFALELVGLLHEKVRVRPTPYRGGLFIGRDCHTIGDSSALVCNALKGKVSQSHLDAYEQAWSLWNRVRKTLNRASIIPRAEAALFRADTAAMVRLLKGSFAWVSISPKLHILMCHAPAFLESFGSIGLYGEQGLEAWHGRYGQSAVKYPGATELERAAAFMRAMALAREAGADVLARYAPRRKPAVPGARMARKVGDKRRRENKPQLPICGAESRKAAKKRKMWAAGITKEAATTVGAHMQRAI